MDILFGKYRINRIIGRGRSSTVYLAEHIALGERRAIKRGRPEDGAFRREAMLMKQLRIPGIPILYDLEEDEEYLYIIEEFLDGESLWALVNREGSLHAEQVIAIGKDLCRILQHLHTLTPEPLLYMDLQPANIMICGGRPMLIDYDCALPVREAGRLRDFYGTRGFAAPELYRGETPDVRTDIYSLGAVLYFMLTGRRPGTSGNLRKTPMRDTELAGWIACCLQENRNMRPSSAAGLRKGLSELSDSAGVMKSAGRNKKLSISVWGSSPDSGTMAFSQRLARWLGQQGRRCLLWEKNETDAVRKMAAYRHALPDNYGIYHIDGLSLKPYYGPCVSVEEGEYDVTVFDCGTGLQTELPDSGDLRILICGTRPWEWEDAVHLMDRLVHQGKSRILLKATEQPPSVPERLKGQSFWQLPEKPGDAYFSALLSGVFG